MKRERGERGREKVQGVTVERYLLNEKTIAMSSEFF